MGFCSRLSDSAPARTRAHTHRRAHAHACARCAQPKEETTPSRSLGVVGAYAGSYIIFASLFCFSFLALFHTCSPLVFPHTRGALILKDLDLPKSLRAAFGGLSLLPPPGLGPRGTERRSRYPRPGSPKAHRPPARATEEISKLLRSPSGPAIPRSLLRSRPPRRTRINRPVARSLSIRE